jgi:hypothetical protein
LIVEGVGPVPNRVNGKIVSVTDDGDLISDITGEQLKGSPRDANVRIAIDEEHETFGIFPVEHGQDPMNLIAILDEDDRLRLHLVGDSASMMLGVRPGAPVQVSW